MTSRHKPQTKTPAAPSRDKTYQKTQKSGEITPRAWYPVIRAGFPSSSADPKAVRPARINAPRGGAPHPGKHRPCPVAFLLAAIAPPACRKLRHLPPHHIFTNGSASRIMKKRFFTNGSASRITKKRKVKTALSKRGHMILPSAAQRPMQSRVKKHHMTLPPMAAQRSIQSRVKKPRTTSPSAAAQRPIQSRVKKHHTTLPSAAAQATS